MLRFIQNCNISIAIDSLMNLYFKYLYSNDSPDKNKLLYLILLCINRYVKIFD